MDIDRGDGQDRKGVEQGPEERAASAAEIEQAGGLHAAEHAQDPSYARQFGIPLEFVETEAAGLSFCQQGFEIAVPTQTPAEKTGGKIFEVALQFTMLARISHTLSAAARDKAASTSLRSLTVLDVLFKYASGR
jgi:hypothetical protein